MEANKKITATELHDWLLEAAETDRRLPSWRRAGPASWWPDFVRGWGDCPPDHTRPRLARATPGQVDRYDAVNRIVAGVSSEADRRLLWDVAKSAVFRSRGPAWSHIARAAHANKRTVKNAYELLLHDTAAAWNERHG